MDIHDTRPRHGLTRAEAHRVLSEAREGQDVRESVIRWCLFITGDLEVPPTRPQAIDDLERRFASEAFQRYAVGLLSLVVPR